MDDQTQTAEKGDSYTVGVAIPPTDVLEQMAEQYGVSANTVASWFTNDRDEILTSADVADRVRISPTHARRLMSTGAIRSKKVGREYRTTGADLLAFINDREDTD